MNQFQHLREVLSLDFKDSSFAGLHPRLQANAEAALSDLNEVLGAVAAHHITDLGLEGAAGHVASVIFAAMDKTGEKAQNLGYTPSIAYLGPRVDRYEVPAPIAVTVASETTSAAAVVIVVFNDTNPSGYGDYTTADALVGGIFNTLDEAKDCVKGIARAISTLNAAMNDIARAEATPTAKYGPSF